MASVIKSARNSGISIFDTVAQTADRAGQAVNTLGLGIDMLHSKAEVYHSEVISESAGLKADARERGYRRAAIKHMRALEELDAELGDDEHLHQAYEALVQKYMNTIEQN